uniref:Uncharacterized protein n=1 Tax=Setaria italica TaxID=4555 RepID=K4ANR0_SETIT
MFFPNFLFQIVEKCLGKHCIDKKTRKNDSHLDQVNSMTLVEGATHCKFFTHITDKYF